ncbi:MAG: hypothetical protein Q4A16_00500 [Lautropia sp.]|nr:hypothetical protein [Lautropia sp.]
MPRGSLEPDRKTVASQDTIALPAHRSTVLTTVLPSISTRFRHAEARDPNREGWQGDF